MREEGLVSGVRIDGCVGCSTCVETCPMDVFRMNARGTRAEVRYPAGCQVCYLCQTYCPVDAITILDLRVVPAMKAWG